MGPLRWGMIGAGKICNDFAACLFSLPREEHVLQAVGASDAKKAAEFAKLFEFSKSYGSYEEVAKDPNVDIIYIGTINPNHYEICKMVLENGKHVLCEKPLTLLLEHTKELISLAQSKRLFFQEAVWSRFFPTYFKLRELLKSGAIGEVKLMTVNFGVDIEDVDRLAKKDMGGGSLMDLGIYTLQISLQVFGPEMPETIRAVGSLNKEGVDKIMSAVLQWKSGQISQIASCMVANTPREAVIFGSKGSITLPFPFWCTTQIILKQEKDQDGGKDGEKQKVKTEQTWDYPLPTVRHPLVFDNGQGMVYEAQEVRRCFEKGLTESPHYTHQDSINIHTMIDQIKRQIGVSFDELYAGAGAKTTKAHQ